ncbi:hypothetical protein [Streptomyces cyaneofuscatus]|uniref:hypothetical protein n=1 Tax=Streptomyces cyaneofuscatus TaxID=66883 RepID=UPI0033A4A62B
MVNNLGWAELLPSFATDISPFVKGLGKFQDSLSLYGAGTAVAGLEGVNQIIREVHAAHAVWTRPDEDHHLAPSFRRFAFGILNVVGYGLYGAGEGGDLGRRATGGVLMIVTAANVLKQHFLPEEKAYRPRNFTLPLHRGDVSSASASREPVVGLSAIRESDDRWLQAGELEAGTLKPVLLGPPGHIIGPAGAAQATGASDVALPASRNALHGPSPAGVPRPAAIPLPVAPVHESAVHRSDPVGVERPHALHESPPRYADTAPGDLLPVVNSVVAAAAMGIPRLGRSRSLPDLATPLPDLQIQRSVSLGHAARGRSH